MKREKCLYMVLPGRIRALEQRGNIAVLGLAFQKRGEKIDG